MASEELRKRLEALNGGPLSSVPSPSDSTSPPTRPAAATRAARAKSIYTTAVVSLPSVDRCALSESLDKLVGGETRSLSDGRGYYALQTCLSSAGCLTQARIDHVCRVLESSSFRDHLRRPTKALPAETLFLDLETLGLHGEPLFLIGLLALSGDGAATCIQLLARGPEEEAAILDRCASHLRGSKLLLTYNGRSFDVPFLKARFDRHGMRCPRIPTHVDLLIEARLRYRGRYRDCRLQTLERHLCGRERAGDIPGSRIPAAYQKSVETGNAADLATILLHNRLDLATTAELVSHFWND